MSMTPGTKLGPYAIVALIGAGGMGEVYRAHDMKLGREVAIKVLPEAFAQDPGRMARFEREARVLASLNHPNIAQIYGVEGRALVMELVEGNSPKGPMPFEEAWKIAIQIADALEYAHEKGIIHRDLKPANVKVTPEGIVKLLDFGLAKAFAPEDTLTANPENSPTLTMGGTNVGVILGTAGYMAPEQAKGKTVDKRADIWSFGVVLYELVTGERLFQGEDVSDTLAQVLTKEPDLERIPTQARGLLSECLHKDPKSRLRDIGDAKRLLGGEADPSVSRLRNRAWLGWVLVSVFVVAAAGLGWIAWNATRRVQHSLVRLDVDLGSQIILPAPSNRGDDVIISPDGTRIAYRASVSGGQPTLFTRRLDEAKATELSGTEGAGAPFFSPDGQWIGFSVAPNKLSKVSVEGGAVVPLADVNFGSGASWSGDGSIIGAVGTAGATLLRLAPGAGEPERLTELAKGEIVQGFPQILPGGKAVLFVAYEPGNTGAAGNIEVLTLADRKRKVLIRGANSPQYVPTGHLLYLNESTLFAIRFDLEKLETRGTPVPILDDVAHELTQSHAGQFDVSRSGTLVYRRTGAVSVNREVTLEWLHANGKREALPAKPGFYQFPRLSPDGKLLAVSDFGSDAIQVYDLQRGTWTRVASMPQGMPEWTPDGQYIIFPSVVSGTSWIRLDRPGEVQPLMQTGSLQNQFSFTGDGKRLAYVEFGSRGQGIFTAPVDNRDGQLRAGKSEPFRVGQSVSNFPRFSSDGRWLAFTSLETPDGEVYVGAFPSGGTWQISEGGGRVPVWSEKTHELLYQSGEKIMAAAYSIDGNTFIKQKPRVWAEKVGALQWDVAPGGKRLIVLKPVATPEAPKADHEVVFLMNFFDYLRQRVSVNK